MDLRKKNFQQRCCQALKWAAQRSGGITIPKGIYKIYRCGMGTWGHGLMMHLAGEQLNSILELFPIVNVSRVPY